MAHRRHKLYGLRPVSAAPAIRAVLSPDIALAIFVWQHTTLNSSSRLQTSDIE